MNIKVIGSGSSGNCYRISDGETAILLEAGLPIKKIKAGCDFNLSAVSGCLVTHEHGDHAVAINDVMKAGVDVYATRGTAQAADATMYRMHLLDAGCLDRSNNPVYHSFKVGTLKIKPFTVNHDAVEPVGYLITSAATGGRLLFITDSYYTEYTFPKLTHIMIEANYSAETIADDPNARRVRRSHMSIETCLKTLAANDLSAVQEIWLIHLSSRNADAEKFKQLTQEATGCPVYIA